MDKLLAPTQAELHDLFVAKYGEIENLNWSPALRYRYDYYNPDDITKLL